MNVYCFVWNDAEKNRHIEMNVEYRLAQGSVRIETITPTKVSFYGRQGGEVTRSIGVHTATGQRLLLAAYYESISQTHLKAAILAGKLGDEDSIEPRIAV